MLYKLVKYQGTHFTKYRKTNECLVVLIVDDITVIKNKYLNYPPIIWKTYFCDNRYLL